jgi:hypothetical protein
MPKVPETQQDPFLPDDDEMPEFGPPESELLAAEDAETESEEDETKEREAQLQSLGQTLDAKFRDCERKRIYVEDRWLEDLRQYHGKYDPATDAALRDSESCSLFLNITKPKTHAFSARVMDMVLPTDEKNWGLQPTPVPEIAGFDGSSEKPVETVDPATGQPVPLTAESGEQVQEKDLIQGVKDEAAARCEAMEDEIDDQLAETKYNGVQRQAIEQMSKLGTGVIMGPVILDEWRVTWAATPAPTPEDPKHLDYQRKLVPNTGKRPGAQWVDCWNFYPDMSSPRPDGWEFAFVQYLVNAGEFKKYAKRYNFMPEAAKRVLDGSNTFSINALRWMVELKNLSETNTHLDERYRLLRFHGELSEDDLRAVGMDPDEMGIEGAVRGSVWFVGTEVLKVDLNPLDSGDLPFSVCYCDKDESSPFGSGIPRLMRGEQESVNGAWRMKHDNAGLSVCPQTVIRYSAVTPADGDYHMKPKKLWYVSDDVQRISDVFGQFSVDSHQAELDNILQLAIRFADDVTQLPLLMQGDQAPHITQTAQGMSLLYNASTVVLRRTVKFYDDFITEPMIGRFYEWNMQFNPRSDIKGDFRAIARGSSTLLDKEQQGQALDGAMQLAMQPTWQPYIDMKKLLRQGMKAKRIDDIMLTDDEIDKNLKAQQEAAAAAQAAEQGGQGAAPAAPPDPLAQAKIDAMNRATDARIHDTDSHERIAVANLASKEGISLGQAQVKLASVKITTDAANKRFNEEIRVKSIQGTGI